MLLNPADLMTSFPLLPKMSANIAPRTARCFEIALSKFGGEDAETLAVVSDDMHQVPWHQVVRCAGLLNPWQDGGCPELSLAMADLEASAFLNRSLEVVVHLLPPVLEPTRKFLQHLSTMPNQAALVHRVLGCLGLPSGVTSALQMLFTEVLGWTSPALMCFMLELLRGGHHSRKF
jgi:hypothetical protein